jgi:uncharacterized protein
MDEDRRRVDSSNVSSRWRGSAVPVAVALLALLIGAAGVLAWQLTSEPVVHTGSGAPPKTSARGGTARNRPVPPAPTVTEPTTPAGATAGPIRLVEIGDSLGVDLGEAMESSWPATSARLTMAARGDTGLSNRAYYNWPTVLAGLLANTRPQVVIVFLGANDLQSMVAGSTILYDGTPAWNAEYAVRVTAVISESVRSGARVLWIGEPVMQTAFINAGMARLDGIAERVVARYPDDAAYLSSNSVLAPDGSFSFYARGLTGGQVQVRTPDGVHLMPAGAELLAAAVAKALAETWGMHVAVR